MFFWLWFRVLICGEDLYIFQNLVLQNNLFYERLFFCECLWQGFNGWQDAYDKPSKLYPYNHFTKEPSQKKNAHTKNSKVGIPVDYSVLNILKVLRTGRGNMK